MITDNITVFGDRENVRDICDLLAKCTDTLQVEVTPATVYAQKITEQREHGEDECVIFPYESRDKISCKGKVLTYSLENSTADVAALNLQKRETSICFEVLCGASMSRIFIPLSSSYTQEQVLVCACVLCAFGVAVDKAVFTLNEIIKRTHS